MVHCQPSLKISCKSVQTFVLKVANRQTNRKVKRYIGFLYSAAYTVEPEQLASQSRKWQLIGKSQWCCGAMRSIHCPRQRTLDLRLQPASTPPPQSTIPGLHPRKHSPDVATPSEVADHRLPLTTHLSTSKG